MFQRLLAKAFGTKNDRELKRIQPIVQHIRSLEAGLQKLSDDELRAKTWAFKEKLSQGASLDDILPEAFAVVREASGRKLGLRHYDVQMIGGYALHKGTIAEMRTGEGKTLVATLPAYLNGLTGKGVHVVTVNDYLARRDCEQMSRIYNFLGLSSGVVTTTVDEYERRAAYQADITYGQNNELGFDYLRDNMKYSLGEMVHRYLPTQPGGKAKTGAGGQEKLLNFAIVDEVDSILIDEARTPLIISGRGEDSTEPYLRANAIVGALKREQDFIVDEKSHSVSLTEQGVDRVEARLKIGNLFDAEHMHWVHYIQAALKAHTLYRLGVNYLIEEGKIVIIDEHTGRKMPGRRWSDGIHQSIEAKEGLKIQQETQTLATITFQNYFRMYDKLCGMTGTAETEAEEFAKIYNLDCLVIPTNKPICRVDHEDIIYKTEREKFRQVITHIEQANQKGQPVLVGTISVAKSEFLAELLEQKGIAHNVLNAKQHQREAEIVAQAGRLGAVTISTNMAGRGTDILLGGNPELLARNEVYGAGAVHQAFNEDDPAYQEALARYKALCAEEKQQVLAAGGLLIIGTERHESRRIDNQLRGRAGRQGDPGESQFYLSLDDDLMRVFGGDRVRKIMEFLRIPEDEAIIAPSVTKAIGDAQKRLEGQHFDARKNVLEYDDVMNLQRRAIYARRRWVLSVEDTRDLVNKAVTQVVHYFADKHCPDGANPLDWDLEALGQELLELTREDLDLSDLPRDFDKIRAAIESHLTAEYEDRRKRMIDQVLHSLDHGDDADAATAEAESRWAEYERDAYLRAIDEHWREHLRTMDGLKEGVYLEAYAQKDPKLIYKKEGHELFQQMIARIEVDVVEKVFQVQVKSADELERMRAEAEERRARQQKQLQEHHHAAALHEEVEAQLVEANKAAVAAQQAAQNAAQQAGQQGQRRQVSQEELAQIQQRMANEAQARLAAMPEHKRKQLENRAALMRKRAAGTVARYAARKAAALAAAGAAAPTNTAPPAALGEDDDDDGPDTPAAAGGPKIGRNDPCWCGSGLKYKKCHMDADAGR